MDFFGLVFLNPMHALSLKVVYRIWLHISIFPPIPLSVTPVAVHAKLLKVESQAAPCVSGNEWVRIAAWSSSAAVLGVLSDELFWFCLQNEIGFMS